MENIKIGIAFLTVCIVSVSFLLPGPRDWFKSIKRNPFAAFLIILSVVATFLGNEKGFTANNPVDTVRALRIAVLALISGAALIAASGNKKRAGSSGSLIWMTGYAFLAVFSAAYSKQPLLSLYKGCEVAAFVVLGLYIGTILHTWQDVEDIVNVMLLALWYLIVSAIVGLVITPSIAFASFLSADAMAFSLRGLFPVMNPNTLTQLGGTLACCCLCRIFRATNGWREAGVWVVFLAALLCMVLAHSRTSLFAFPVAIFVVFLSFRKKALTFFFTILAGLAAVIGSLNELLVSYMMRGQSAQGFATIDGRTAYWDVVIKKFWESPILGYGFYGQRFIFGASNTESAYFEVLLNLGLIGFTIFCLAILGVIFDLWRSQPKAPGPKQIFGNQFIWAELVVIVIFLLVRGLTGPTFNVLHLNLPIFVLTTVCASAVYRLMRTEPLSQEATQMPAASDLFTLSR